MYLELAETIGLMFRVLNTQTYTLVIIMMIIIQIKGARRNFGGNGDVCGLDGGNGFTSVYLSPTH